MKPYEKENNDGERKQPMKKVISLMLALVLALSLTACGGKAGPEGVVDQFCKGLQKLDEKAIAQCFETVTIWSCRIWRTWTVTMP